jgi:hypothetical protein
MDDHDVIGIAFAFGLRVGSSFHCGLRSRRTRYGAVYTATTGAAPGERHHPDAQGFATDAGERGPGTTCGALGRFEEAAAS